MAGKERIHDRHFPKCIVLQAIFWYLRYSLSYRDIEEFTKERGVEIDHATVQRWVVKYTSILEVEFRKRKKTILTQRAKNQDKLAAKRFLIKAIDNNGVPEKITINGSAAKKSALEEYNN